MNVHRPRILLVEDERLTSMVTAAMLQRNGYVVDTVFNGPDAVNRATNADAPGIDLILMDIDLGNGMDGTGAARLILEQNDIPILFLSSHTEPEVVSRVEEITSYGYVVKNSGDTVLLASIRMAFRLRDAREEWVAINQELAATNEELRASMEQLDDTNHLLVSTGEALSQRERELQKNEVKLRLIADFSADWEYWIDPDGTFEFISSSCETITGYSPDDFRSDPDLMQSIVHPDDAERVRHHLEREKTLDGVVSMDYRIVTRGGEVRWLRHRCMPVHDAEGTWLGRRGSNRDISEFVGMNRAVEDTRNNYELFFNTIDDFMFVLDVDGSILHVNRTVVDRLGYSEAELEGQPVVMVHPEDRREEAASIVRDMLAGIADFCPVPLRTRDGLLIPVETRVRTGMWNGKAALFGVSKDISRIKVLLDEKSMLLREVHHRIKNNMATVASLLSIQSSSSGNKDISAALANAAGRIGTMMVLYDQLYHSDITGSMPMSAYLQPLLGNIRATVPDRDDIRVSSDIDSVDVPAGVLAHLGIMVNELVANAYKHAFPASQAAGGQDAAAERQHPEISISARVTGGTLVLTVRDNGAGAPDGRGAGQDMAVREAPAGGLGLLLVNALAAQNGGTVTIATGGGTTVTITMPFPGV